MYRPRSVTALALLGLWLNLYTPAAQAEQSPPPFADAHIHYNWDQAELITPAEVISRLQQQGIVLAVLASTPTAMARQLSQQAPWIIPLFSPYIREDSRNNWYQDQRVLEEARQGLEAGWYRGIGEVHFMAGFPPRPDNRIFQGLLKLARHHRVPMLIHVDASSESRYLEICTGSPDIRFVLAHAGGILGPQQVRNILQRCPNSMMDLSARDPWRYGGLTDDNGQLLPDWNKLVLDYPRRFLAGTDPVWRVTRTQSWEQADDGWDHLPKLVAWNRRWISGLPEEIRKLLLEENTRRFWQPGVNQDKGK